MELFQRWSENKKNYTNLHDNLIRPKRMKVKKEYFEVYQQVLELNQYCLEEDWFMNSMNVQIQYSFI